MLTGFLALDKPVGVRSTACVEKVRRAAGRSVKVGHGGTLDSSARGLLVILLGGATRLSNLVMQMPKIYRAVIALGAETTTCDATGERLSCVDWRYVDETAIERMLPAFLGWRMQVPPQISAVHVDGRRAHEMARGGEIPQIEPRPVFIEKIERLSSLSNEGKFVLKVRCGKGTYVRSIARDLGRALGCGAHIAALSRESVGPLRLSEAWHPDDQFSISRNELLSMVQPLAVMEKFLPCYCLPDAEMAKLASGLGACATDAFRISAGDRSPARVIVARSESLFSVCKAEYREGRLSLSPETNIKLGAL